MGRQVKAPDSAPVCRLVNRADPGYRLPVLNPETFSVELGSTHWRFHTTERLGQFDIAVPGDDHGNPDPAALAHLETALAAIDALYDRALVEAEQGWIIRYKGPPRSRDAWSLIRLLADRAGRLVLSLNEGEYDTYCLWDITFVDGKPAGVVHRIWGGPG